MTDRIRLTISVSPEVHDVFSKMAEAGGMSLSKCMGDWLEDTVEGAQFVTQKMVEARRAPRTVMREMQAMARGLHQEVNAEIERMRRGGAGGGAVAARTEPPRVAQARSAPSSNTGLKVGNRKGRST